MLENNKPYDVKDLRRRLLSEARIILIDTIIEIKRENGEDLDYMFSDPRYMLLSKYITEDYKRGSK